MNRDQEKTIAWYRISVIKAAMLATVIMVAAYIVSLVTVREINSSLAQLAYDPEVEYSLTDYLDQIKEIDRLKRESLALRLQQILHNSPSNQIELRNLLVKVGIEEVSDTASLTFERLSASSPVSDQTIDWISRSQLKVFDWLVTAPATEARQKFEYSQAIWQRYQLISSTWNEQIGPTFVTIQGLILASSFLILGLSLVLMARRYRRRIHILLSGFSQWSERDHEFRFRAADLKSDELNQIAQQFNTMADEVELNRQRRLFLEKISSWQTIARKMAHEIKNPLTPIQMMVSHLERSDPKTNPSFTELLTETSRIVSEEIAALRRMVDNFSDFAKLPTPKRQQADLVETVRHVYELQKMAILPHELTLTTDLEEAPCYFDPQQIRQVLSNLIKNASEAQSQGLNISLALAADKQQYEIRVIDDGPGIDPEDLNRIFEAYFTTKHTGAQPGMGLGLAICKKIIIEHGGELMVSSRPGKTVFRILLKKSEGPT